MHSKKNTTPTNITDKLSIYFDSKHDPELSDSKYQPVFYPKPDENVMKDNEIMTNTGDNPLLSFVNYRVVIQLWCK